MHTTPLYPKQVTKKVFRSAALLFIFLMFRLSGSAQQTELKYLSGLDKDHTVSWDFMCTRGRNSGTWTKIPVPSNWELKGFGNYTYGYEKEDREEAGLYRHSFSLPADWKNKEVFIVFDGSMTDTEVKINGQLAGPVHQGAFYRFRYNITSLLKPNQENVLEVKVNKVSSNQTVNEAERTADFWVFGGIFRPVFLEAYPRNHLERLAIDAKANGAIQIDAFVSNLKTEGSIVAQVKTKDGKAFGKPITAIFHPGDSVTHLKAQLPQPAAWSPEFPNLYKIEVSLRKGAQTLHTLTETIGFRTIELRKHDGFYVNGQKIRFKGVNRGSFWPTSGRTTSKQISIDDANLIKDMNMNAVRMSHYPPDKHFLEVCDSLGLFVINELTGWQYPPYDTGVGRKLVKELVVRDVNHPSVVLWANGNEGGFNYDLLPDYPRYDIQNRPVIQPWMNINGMNTKHYIPWNYGIGTFFQGDDVFFPTEFLHGLYDGGQGAGLDDFWNLMRANPLSAGGFLWDFCDQAVVRTDKAGSLDTKGNSAADGILGPYREKEGSFYTVKEIWAPIFFEKKYITDAFDGAFKIENRYDFSNLKGCKFSYKLKKISGFAASDTSILAGSIQAPDIKPNTGGTLHVALPASWKQYDVLYIRAQDRAGREIYTWSWPIGSAAKMSERLVSKGTGKVTVQEDQDLLTLTAGGLKVMLNKGTGLLEQVEKSKNKLSFNHGPILIAGEEKLKSFRHYDTLGSHVAEAVYEGNTHYKLRWTMMPSGWLELQYEYRPENQQSMLGVTFNYPEKNVKGMQLIGNGPYRVYKNRLKGVTLNSWTKTYNNAITGEVWTYPEFKGYYSNFYGVKIQTTEGDFKVLTATDNLFLHMLNPAEPAYVAKTNSTVVYPSSGGISFMHGIPAIGTKSQKPEDLGPQSQTNLTFANGGLETMKGTLFFDFR
jgi:hypothetical protein